MRELRMLGSVRGVLSNGYPYRDPLVLLCHKNGIIFPAFLLKG